MIMSYLGACMVIIVTGLVVAVLSRLVTGGILDEIERFADKRRKRKIEMVGKMMESAAKYVTVYVEKLKETDILEKKARENGASNEEMKNEAVKCMNSTLDEMVKEAEKKPTRKRTAKAKEE